MPDRVLNPPDGPDYFRTLLGADPLLPPAPFTLDAPDKLQIRLPALVHDLRERGSIVLIDAPPLLGIADAHFMAALADGVVLVTSAGKERPSEVRAALDSLELLDANLLGVVLNHAKTEFAPAYGYYGHGRRGRAGRRLGGSPSAESSLESDDV